MNKINFYFQTQEFVIKKRRVLKGFLEYMFDHQKILLKSLNIIFCDDEYILAINTMFLKHNYYTDVITFNLADIGVEGEIYISIDRIKANSKKFKVSINEELHRVIIHGVLHLTGIEDNTAIKKKAITEKENFYLNKYFANK